METNVKIYRPKSFFGLIFSLCVMVRRGIILKWILEKWDGEHGLDRSASG